MPGIGSSLCAVGCKRSPKLIWSFFGVYFSFRGTETTKNKHKFELKLSIQASQASNNAIRRGVRVRFSILRRSPAGLRCGVELLVLIYLKFADFLSMNLLISYFFTFQHRFRGFGLLYPVIKFTNILLLHFFSINSESPSFYFQSLNLLISYFFTFLAQIPRNLSSIIGQMIYEFFIFYTFSKISKGVITHEVQIPAHLTTHSAMS